MSAMRAFVKNIWIGLHVGLTCPLFWFAFQDLQSKGQADPSRVGQGVMLLFMCFAIVAFILALTKKGAELLFPALRRWQSQQTVGGERER